MLLLHLLLLQRAKLFVKDQRLVFLLHSMHLMHLQHLQHLLLGSRLHSLAGSLGWMLRHFLHCLR